MTRPTLSDKRQSQKIGLPPPKSLGRVRIAHAGAFLRVGYRRSACAVRTLRLLGLLLGLALLTTTYISLWQFVRACDDVASYAFALVDRRWELAQWFKVPAAGDAGVFARARDKFPRS